MGPRLSDLRDGPDGSFRYCRSCGLDFDAPAQDASTPATAAPAPMSEAAPAAPSTAGPTDAPYSREGDVVVVQVRHLRLLAWVIAGGLIGAMLAGAIVVPFFGKDGVVLGSIVGIATIVVSAWLGSATSGSAAAARYDAHAPDVNRHHASVLRRRRSSLPACSVRRSASREGGVRGAR